MSSPDSTDFGAMLRSARERRGVTLKQLADTTKISPSVLTALEANDLGQLPGGLFIRAFVRSYAAEVGLDPEHTVDALLKACRDQRHDTVVRSRDEPAGSGHGRHQAGVRGTAIGLVIISVIVVGLLLYFGLRGSAGSASEGGGALADDVADAGLSSDVASCGMQRRPNVQVYRTRDTSDVSFEGCVSSV